MVDRCDFWDGGSIHAAVISLASPGLVGDRTVHTQSQPNSQLRRERDGSWQTSRYIPYTRISGDPSTQLWRNTRKSFAVSWLSVALSVLASLGLCASEESMIH